MKFDEMSYADLRDLKREKGLARAVADREAREELLEIQAALDIKQRERVARMLAAAPGGVMAEIEAAAAAADSGVEKIGG